MFTILRNDRIKNAPVALIFEDLSDRTGDHWWHNKREVPLEEGILVLARLAFAPKYDARFHKLFSVKWDDDKTSYAFVSWSAGNDARIYINSACGSPLFTVKIDKAAFLASL